MRTPKKVWKNITGKLKNRKGTSAAKGADIEAMPEEEMKVEVTNVTEIDAQQCKDINKNSEDPQPTCESKEEVQNASVDTTAREPNTPDIQPSTEPCSGSGKGNSAGERSSKRTSQPIVAGIVGAILLASGVASYILNMPIVAVVGGIVGLACIGFSLYNTLKPNTKLEKVDDIEQPAFFKSDIKRYF